MEPTYPDWTGTRLSLHRQGGTAVVRLFNPPHGFMDEAMETELAYALDQLDAWPEGRVVVLTGGEPGMFVRHYDVAVLHQRAQAMLARGKTFSVERPVAQGGIHRCIERIDASPCMDEPAVDVAIAEVEDPLGESQRFSDVARVQDVAHELACAED